MLCRHPARELERDRLVLRLGGRGDQRDKRCTKDGDAAQQR
jgi:hypothetical protein